MVGSLLLAATGCSSSTTPTSSSACDDPQYALRYETGYHAGAIAIYDADGTQSRPGRGWITGEPSFSPDGRSLAVAWFESIGEGRQTSIAILRTDPERRRVIRGTDRGEYPAWSPDGSTIAYARNDYNGGKNEIRLMDATTGAANHAIVSEGDPKRSYLLGLAWSPDGKKIAFLVNNLFSEPSGVWIVNRDGSDAHQVATHKSYDLIDWRPDGSALVLSNAGRSAVLDLDTGAEEVISESAGAVTWFGHEEQVLYYRLLPPGSRHSYRLAAGTLDGADLRYDHDVANIPPQDSFAQYYGMAAACRR